VSGRDLPETVSDAHVEGANYSQQVATLVTRQALDAERSVAAYVAETANIPAAQA
jgi:hypothetical protein